MSKSKSKASIKRPVRSSEVPATSAMLYETEERLTHKMDSGFARTDSKIEEVKSEVHRVALLVEEQNARNKYVMDGYAQLYELIMTRLQGT